MSLSLTLTPTNQASIHIATDSDDNDENITRIELALARVVAIGSGATASSGVSGTFENATTWTLDHAFPYRPHVSAADAAGRVLTCAIDHISNTRVTATHNAAQSGTLRIS